MAIDKDAYRHALVYLREKYPKDLRLLEEALFVDGLSVYEAAKTTDKPVPVALLTGSGAIETLGISERKAIECAKVCAEAWGLSYGK